MQKIKKNQQRKIKTEEVYQDGKREVAKKAIKQQRGIYKVSNT